MRGAVEGAPPARLRRRRRRGRRKVEERTREKDVTKDEGGSMCVTCVAAITKSRGWLPGNAFQPPHTHTTLNQSPKPPCEIPLRFMAYSFFRSMPLSRSFLSSSRSLFLAFIHSATFSKHGLSSISTLILIRWERLDWHYRFRVGF